jgi:hypothetical protein
VFKKVLRRIFRLKKEEVRGWWRNLHNEELHKLCSPNWYQVFTSGEISWLGMVAGVGGSKKCTQNLLRNSYGIRHEAD